MPCLGDNRTRLIERAYWIFLKAISGDAKLNAKHFYSSLRVITSVKRSMSCANTIVSVQAELGAIKS